MPECPKSTDPTHPGQANPTSSTRPSSKATGDIDPPTKKTTKVPQGRTKQDTTVSTNPALISNKKQILERSGITVSSQIETVEMQWEQERNNWEILDLSYDPDNNRNSTASDELGNYPNWMYRARHKTTNYTALLGPNDVETFFAGSKEESKIKALREEKEATQKDYKQKIIDILTLKGLIPEEDITAKLEQLEALPKIGDKDFEFIDQALQVQELTWKETGLDKECSLHEFIQTLNSLNALLKHLNDKNNDLSYLSRQDISTELAFTRNGNIPTDTQVKGVLELHEILSSIEKQISRETTSWARKQAIAVDRSQAAATPAYHALIRIATFLNDIFPNKTPNIIDIGANLDNFRQTANKLFGNGGMAQVASATVAFENDDKIYNLTKNLNPHSALGSISVLNDQGLPLIREGTDECAGILSEPHFFDAAIASFVLDQLEPEEVRNAIIAFENLLAKPPDGKQTEQITKETLSKYPILVIASPEHAPLAGTRFSQILEDKEIGGYEVVIQEFVVNELTKEAKDRIQAQGGKDTLAAVESLAGKPFHLSIYAKVKEANIEKLKKEPKKSLIIKSGHSRRRKDGDGKEKLAPGLNPDRLVALDILSNIKANDFEASSSEPVSRYAIANDTDNYGWFEDNLACLIHYKELLPRAEQSKLDMVTELWDTNQAQFLSKGQVDFVKDQPHLTEVKYSSLPISVQIQIDKEHEPILQTIEIARRGADLDEDKIQAAVNTKRRELQKEKYSLWDVYQREYRHRKEKNQENIFDQTRPALVKGVNAIKKAIETGKTTQNALIEEVRLPWVMIEQYCSDYGFNLELSPDMTANNIRNLMTKKTWSRSQLAQEMKEVAAKNQIETDINPSRVSSWLYSGATPNSDDLKLLTMVFGVKESDIVPKNVELSVKEVLKTFTESTTTNERIKTFMSNKNWSQPQLAQEIKTVAAKNLIGTDISQNRVNSWLSHEITPNSNDLTLLALVFGVQEHDIVPEHVELPAQEIVKTFTEDTQTSERIKALMANKNWSQPQLVQEMKKVAAENNIKTDINRGRVSSWLHTGAMPNPSDLKLLALTFEVQESDMVPEHVELPVQEIVKTFTKDTKTSERIKALMLNKNWSQLQLVQEMEELAAKNSIETDINKGRVKTWFRQKATTPNPSDLKLLALVFKVQESDIVPE